ncbi:MAG: hypothetical protein L0Y57_02305 [Beijerinckiaceae bacterium]|nr:hypothetical protein [Beijerinckiaceae bacterium]
MDETAALQHQQSWNAYNPIRVQQFAGLEERALIGADEYRQAAQKHRGLTLKEESPAHGGFDCRRISKVLPFSGSGYNSGELSAALHHSSAS